MRRSLSLGTFVIGVCWTMSSHAAEGNEPAVSQAGDEVLKGAVIHRTVEAVERARASRSTTTTTNLTYHGGTGGIGVETTPKIYLILWGSQWTNNDPSGEAAILENFYRAIMGSSWLNTVTQYCQNVPTGTTFCNLVANAQAAGDNGTFAGVWADNASAAPSHPKQSQLAAEAVRAAQHFGNTSATSNDNAQYVVATATGNNSSGFGRQYCAYHSSTSSAEGDVAYTNMPYITDAGASCGANFNGLGAKAGITIVSGHEAAETITDQFPSTGWLDSSGSEIGDKCAWIATGSQGASQDVTFGTGGTYPVQSLWSNAFNRDVGGCVISYP